MTRTAASLILAALLCASTPTHAAERPLQAVTIVIPQASVLFTALYLGDELGLWKKHGLDVKLVVVTGVGSINAVISGSAEFGVTSGTSMLRAAAKGQRLLAIAANNDRLLIEIVLRKDIAVAAGFDAKAPFAQRASSLRGHTMAIEGINGQADAYLRLAAKRAGFDAADIRLAIMPVTSMSAALATRQIDGFAASLPYPSIAISDGGAVKVASGPDGEPADMVPIGFSLVVTKPETCVDRKDLCRALGAAFVDEVSSMRAHPAEALALMERRFSTVSPELVAAVFAAVLRATPDPPVVSRVHFENSDRFNIETGLMDPADRLKSYDGLYTDEYVRGSD